MNRAAPIAAAIAFAVVVELAVPGRSLYHDGWYNAALIALIVILGFQVRRLLASGAGPVARAGLALVFLGVGIAGLSAAASGLLAPDDRLIVAAPGSTVPEPEFGGALVFAPVASASGSGTIRLERGASVAPIGGWRYTGSSVLWLVPRSVLFVRARDLGGASLTITQPSEAAAFLSPVLLLQKTQPILGMDLPFDTFALPAVHRIVRAIFFSRSQVAMARALGHSPFAADRASVLFAVEDDNGAGIPHGFAMAKSGGSVTVGGVRLSATALTYPAVEVAAAPSQPALLIAGALMAIGALLLLRTRSRS